MAPRPSSHEEPSSRCAISKSPQADESGGTVPRTDASRPVVNKQTLQNPRGASAKILAPHFGRLLERLSFSCCVVVSLYVPKLRLQHRNEMPGARLRHR